MEQVRLQTLIAGMAEALHNTQVMMEQAKLEHFMSYFTEKDKVNLPRTMDVEIGIPERGERKEGRFSIPLATLVSHRALTMDTVEVRIKTELTSVNNCLMAQVGGPDRKESSGEEDGSQCEIKLVFRNEEPSDGIQEADRLLNKSI